ncbi:MAG: DUF998 domain-containing protein [Candidatus Hodarchaeota archaeon]
MNQTTRILTGRAKPKIHVIYLVCVAVAFSVILIACGALYHEPFTFRSACPSNLGNPGLNPRGWVLFNLLMIACGVLIIPHALYLHRRILPITKGLTNAMLVFMLAGCAGMVGVGFFNETLGDVHYIFAAFAFGGFGIATFLGIPILIRKNVIDGKSGPVVWLRVIILYGIIFTLVVLMFREFAIFGFDKSSELFLAEWYALFAILTWMFGFFFTLPAKDNSKA